MVYYLFALLLLPIIAIYNSDEDSYRHYWFYNTAAYCDATQISKWKVGKISNIYPKVTDIHLYEKNKSGNFAYLVYNPSINTIILTFRGSRSSFKNWIQDLKFLKKKYSKCRKCSVHQGFYDAYESLPVSKIMSDLKNLKSLYPSAKVVISGHSLGGAIANLAYLDACDIIPKVDLLITYGSPRVGNKKFAEFFESKNCKGGERIRVVHSGDFITKLPPKWAGFEHAQSLIFYENNKNTKFVECKEVERDQYKISKNSFKNNKRYFDFDIQDNHCS